MSVHFQELKNWWEQPVCSMRFLHWGIKMRESEVSCLQDLLFYFPYLWKVTGLTCPEKCTTTDHRYEVWLLWSKILSNLLFQIKTLGASHCFCLWLSQKYQNIFQQIGKQQKYWNESCVPFCVVGQLSRGRLASVSINSEGQHFLSSDLENCM